MALRTAHVLGRDADRHLRTFVGENMRVADVGQQETIETFDRQRQARGRALELPRDNRRVECIRLGRSQFDELRSYRRHDARAAGEIVSHGKAQLVENAHRIRAFNGRRHQVHGADELARERIDRRLIDLFGRPDLQKLPARMTAIRSAMARASAWSWVTMRVVMPSRRCSGFSSLRRRPRICGSSAESGSSSSRTAGPPPGRARSPPAVAARRTIPAAAVGQPAQIDGLEQFRHARPRRAAVQREGDVLAAVMFGKSA